MGVLWLRKFIPFSLFGGMLPILIFSIRPTGFGDNVVAIIVPYHSSLSQAYALYKGRNRYQ